MNEPAPPTCFLCGTRRYFAHAMLTVYGARVCPDCVKKHVGRVVEAKLRRQEKKEGKE